MTAQLLTAMGINVNIGNQIGGFYAESDSYNSKRMSLLLLNKAESRGYSMSNGIYNIWQHLHKCPVLRTVESCSI